MYHAKSHELTALHYIVKFKRSIITILLMYLTQYHQTACVCSWITPSAQNALLWHECMLRDVCATHPWQFVPSHARSTSDAASAHRRFELDKWQISPRTHPYTKHDIMAFRLMWLKSTHTSKMCFVLLTIMQNGDIVFNCYFYIMIWQDRVTTLCILQPLWLYCKLCPSFWVGLPVRIPLFLFMP